MDFFKSLLSDPTPPSSPTHNEHTDFTPPTSPPPQRQSSSSSSSPTSFFTSIASKSDSFLQNYYKDLQEFTTAFKQETSIISRVVQDLPARLDSGATIAQNSLEALGQAVDNLGSTIVNTGKDFNFTPNYSMFLAHLDKDRDVSGGSSGDEGKDSNFGSNYGKDLKHSGVGNNIERPYSRLEAMIRSLQCNLSTYCEDDVEDGKIKYDEWIKGFSVEDKRDEIERIIAQNHVVQDIYDEIVPGKVEEESFWSRYFYKVGKLIEAEELRTRMLNRAITGEDDEDLSWDVEEEEREDDDDDDKSKKESKNEIEEIEERDENANIDGSSEGKLGSDVSVISSHRSSSHSENDLGWDKIDDIGSGSENKVGKPKDHSTDDVADVKKQSNFAEDDEDLSWDIEDDD